MNPDVGVAELELSDLSVDLVVASDENFSLSSTEIEFVVETVGLL